jgi:tetratricopeptide (TPR) repeat protein
MRMHHCHIRPAGLIVVLVLLMSGGCANRHPGLETYLNNTSIPSGLELRDTPFFPQQEYQCGPAALATVLAASDISIKAEELTGKVYLPQRRGSLQLELVAATRRYGRLPYVIDGKLPAILSELSAGRPVLVLQNLGLAKYPFWHYAVVVGFDAPRKEIILRSGDQQRFIMSTHSFMRTWELAEYWAMVVLRPGELPDTPDESRYVHGIAALESIGQTDTAAIFYETALSLWPDNTIALFGAGNTAYALGDKKSAEVIYRRLLVRRPDHAAARNNLAFLLAGLGCIEAAIAELDKGLSIVDSEDPMRQHLLNTRTEILNTDVAARGTATSCPGSVTIPLPADVQPH